MASGPARRSRRTRWRVSVDTETSLIFINEMMFSEAKALAEKAMSDPMGAATQGLEKVKFW